MFRPFRNGRAWLIANVWITTIPQRMTILEVRRPRFSFSYWVVNPLALRNTIDTHADHTAFSPHSSSAVRFIHIVQPLSCWSIPLHRPTTVLLAFLVIHSFTSSNHCLADLPRDPFLYNRPTTVLLAFLVIHSFTSSNHCITDLPCDPFLYIVQPLSCWPSSWSIPLQSSNHCLAGLPCASNHCLAGLSRDPFLTSSNHCLAGLPRDPFHCIVQPLSCWPSSWSIPLHRPTTLLLAFLVIHSLTSSNHCLPGLPCDPFSYIVQPLSCWPSLWSIPLHRPTTVLLAFLVIHSLASYNHCDCLTGLPRDPFPCIVQPLSCWPSSWSIPLHRPTTVSLAFLVIHSLTSSSHCLAGLPCDPFPYIVHPLSCWSSSWSFPLHRPTTVLLAFLVIHSLTSSSHCLAGLPRDPWPSQIRFVTVPFALT